MSGGILAIDPGNKESAYVALDENLKPVEFGKKPNTELLVDLHMDRHQRLLDYNIDHFAIEMIASYGMAVGAEVFETVLWIGRFWERANFNNLQKIYRKDVKINLCGSLKAKDSNIRQALIDRFAKHDFKNGKGTKKNPDWFHGFHSDIWAAYAVGVTYHDLYLKAARL